MKTKILKIGMPIMVFMLAIVFAFASEKTTAKNESLVTGYIFKDGKCEISTKNCDENGSFHCTDGGRQVYMIKLSDTVCFEELFNWTP